MNINRRNSTESTSALTPQQVEVITALVRGATVTAATEQANVDRTTFYLWTKSDEVFVAELNRAKQEQADAMRAQLYDLSESAVTTLREVLTGKDVSIGLRVKVALSVLQATGTLEPEPIGETNPNKVRIEQSFANL